MTRTNQTLHYRNYELRLDSDYYVNLKDLYQLTNNAPLKNFLVNNRQFVLTLEKQLNGHTITKSRIVANTTNRSVWVHPVLALQYVIISNFDLAYGFLLEFQSYFIEMKQKAFHMSKLSQYISRKPVDIVQIVAQLEAKQASSDLLQDIVKAFTDDTCEFITLEAYVLGLGYGTCLAADNTLMNRLTDYIRQYYGDSNTYKKTRLLTHLIHSWFTTEGHDTTQFIEVKSTPNDELSLKLKLLSQMIRSKVLTDPTEISEQIDQLIEAV